MTAAESIILKKKLVPNPNPNPDRPLRYHDRTEHVFQPQTYQLQTLLDDLNINNKKTKVILFNRARKL